MTAKEEIAETLRVEGYDFMTAYELAHNRVQEFMKSGKDSEVFHTKTTTFTLQRRNDASL